MLVGTIATTSEVAKMIVKTEIPKKLGSVLLQKDLGEDIVLQLLYTFAQYFILTFRLIVHKELRGIVLENNEVVLAIIEHLANLNMNIRKQAEQLAEIVQYYSPDWTNTIRLKKYKAHNQMYLQALEEYDRMAANAGYVEEGLDDQDPNGIQWYDMNDMGGRIWKREEDPNDY